MTPSFPDHAPHLQFGLEPPDGVDSVDVGIDPHSTTFREVLSEPVLEL